MKKIIKATNNFKDLTSVYIVNCDNTDNSIYNESCIRKYFGMNNNLIYVMNLKNNDIEKTDLKSLENIIELKAYDNQFYGGEFS